jgi:4-hydroxy-tetrahydrodipicolinate synthase
MKNGHTHYGVVVPMVTPVTATGQLDEPAIDRLVDHLLTGGVQGIFVLGTTGEGVSVPQAARRNLVERVVKRVNRRTKIYAGIGDLYPHDLVAGNEYFHAGADAVVARPPISFPTTQLLSWYRSLLDGLEGPLIIYNMPATTNVSIPLDVVGQLIGHPKLAGIKDSENNPARLQELLSRFGAEPRFSIFVGVGALMEQGLKLGAEGIVPSVGNLIPEVCHQLCDCAKRGDWVEAEKCAAQMNRVAALYQKGRTLGQSLAALKAALSFRGLCTPQMLPPLVPLPETEARGLREQMSQLRLVN